MSTPADESSSFIGSSFSDIDPSLSQSDVITTDEPSIIGETSFVSDKLKDKEEGIKVPALPKFTIYHGMQLFGLVALSLGCFLMYLELKSYNLEKEVPEGSVTKVVPTMPVLPPIPKGTIPEAATAPAAVPGAAAPTTPATTTSTDPSGSALPTTPSTTTPSP